MYVLLDANILLADPWQEAAKTSAFIDFLEKTRGVAFVHDVTWQEVRATMERRWSRALEAYDAAFADLARLRIDAATLPLDNETLLSEVSGRWWHQVRRPFPVKKTIPLDNRQLPEIVRRAVQRVPPCARKGEEFRDALMWLDTLDYCQAKQIRHLVFISSNTRDFAAPDGALLPVLAKDAADRNVSVEFYSSVEEFLKEHAEPIEWLTLDWVRQRVDDQEVREVLWGAVVETDVKEYDIRHYTEEDWTPTHRPDVIDVSGSLVDFYVWEYADAEKIVFLIYAVDGTANLRCTREIEYHEGPPYEHWTDVEINTFRVTAQLEVVLYATVKDDAVGDLAVDQVNKL